MFQNPFTFREPAKSTTLRDFFNEVYRVQEIPGTTSDKPSIWRIEVNSQKIDINTNEILSPRKFTAEYLKKFKRLPPSILKRSTNWDKFVEFLGSMLEPCKDEEDVAVFTMNEMMSKIAQMDITNDRKRWLTGNYLLFHEDQLLLASDKITELIKAIGMETDIGTLGRMMVERNIKASGTRHISVQGKKQRAWWFHIDALNEYRDEKIDVTGILSCDVVSN
jgi:hypothetical protein